MGCGTSKAAKVANINITTQPKKRSQQNVRSELNADVSPNNPETLAERLLPGSPLYCPGTLSYQGKPENDVNKMKSTTSGTFEIPTTKITSAEETAKSTEFNRSKNTNIIDTTYTSPIILTNKTLELSDRENSVLATEKSQTSGATPQSTTTHSTFPESVTTAIHSTAPESGTTRHSTAPESGTTRHSTAPESSTTRHSTVPESGTTALRNTAPKSGTTGHSTAPESGTTSLHSTSPESDTTDHRIVPESGATAIHSTDPESGTTGHRTAPESGTTAIYSSDPELGSTALPVTDAVSADLYKIKPSEENLIFDHNNSSSQETPSSGSNINTTMEDDNAYIF